MRTSKSRLALAALLAAACAPTPPPRPLPKVSLRGALVFVDEVRGEYEAEVKNGVRAGLVKDLQTAGAELRPAPSPETVQIVVTLDGPVVRAEVSARGGEQQKFEVPHSELPCYSHAATDEANGACIGRELAIAILDSRMVAQLADGTHGAPAAKLQGLLAVLELRPLTKELTQENARYFTDVVRNAALQSGMSVMTRENLLVLLRAGGKELADCEGECEVDTGRRIGADAIISGDLQKLGSRFKLSLRLHETRQGRLLSSAIASGGTLEQLDDAAPGAVKTLFEPPR